MKNSIWPSFSSNLPDTDTVPGFFMLRYKSCATLDICLGKEPFFNMWFIIFGFIFFIESIILTVYGVKKKKGMLIYFGVVFGIMTLGTVLLKLTGH